MAGEITVRVVPPPVVQPTVTVSMSMDDAQILLSHINQVRPQGGSLLARMRDALTAAEVVTHG